MAYLPYIPQSYLVLSDIMSETPEPQITENIMVTIGLILWYTIIPVSHSSGPDSLYQEVEITCLSVTRILTPDYRKHDSSSPTYHKTPSIHINVQIGSEIYTLLNRL